MWRSVFVVVALGSGCVRSAQSECSGDRVCPAAYACTSFGCASPEQVAACVGVAGGEMCTTSFGGGVCTDNACQVPVCGNSETEPLEACDDGNTINGDGCNGTCTSDESCGNGIAELAEACDCGDAARAGGTLCRDAADVLTINGGAICSMTCTPRRCGDAVVDPGEVCDDGNNASDDGCSFDCQSLEECGNGILDYFAGERCDDGNARDRDGCSALCSDEVPLWHEVPKVLAPTQRFQAQMAYDSARQRWVMFGGQPVFGNVTAIDETWEFSGTSWEKRTLMIKPPPREGAGMAYDARRGRIVMFGGVSRNNAAATGANLGDTWEYDGVAWRLVQPAAAPSARMYSAMAYDGKRHRVVLVGGFDGQYRDDVWEFDGTTWTQVTINGTKPPARYRSALAFDAANARLVLYGGIGQADVVRNDTWSLAGTTWTDHGTSSAIGVRYEHSLAYDSAAGKVVLYGGTNGTTYYGDVYELTTSTWAARTTNTPPVVRAGAVMAGDPVTGKLLVAFGYNSVPTYALADVNILSGGTWSAAPPSGHPPLGERAMAYDAARGRIILLVAPDQTTSLQTWSFDGLSWRNLGLSAANLPTYRQDLRIAYDASRDRVVLHGGNASTDTWEFTGVTWQEVFPTGPPPARDRHALTYDPVRRKVVLFGGHVINDPVAETWEYDGAAGTWTQITTATIPPRRMNHAMAYDLARQRVVMFGGVHGATNAASQDTWEYDGTDWVERSLTAVPPDRASPVLAYDAAQGKVVLFGGANTFGNLDDTWMLDDTRWRQLPSILTAPPPSARVLAAGAYDSARSQIVVNGGFTAGYVDDTWILSIPPSVTPEACMSALDVDHDSKLGCADDECWGMCSSLCPPTIAPASCAMDVPRCGDAMCDGVETCRSCPADCAIGTTCPVRCGDAYCDTAESMSSCPGDCTP